MYQVTEIKAKNKKYIVSIMTEKGNQEYLISEDLFLDFRLLKGKSLSDKEFNDFKKSYSKDEVYQKTLHFALYKPRCTYEIIEYLKRNKVDESEFNYHLHKLYKSRILDDEQYAKNYINDSIELKKTGIKKIVYELDNKHIKKEIYEPIISNISNKIIEQNLNYLLEKKINSLKPESLNKAIQNLKQFIVNKGYDYEQASQAINEHMDSIREKANEDESLRKDIRYAKNKYKAEDTKKNEKVLAYLLRKGYSYHKIKAVIGEYDNE